MIDLFENCLALVAGLCVNTPVDAHLISSWNMRGASMEIMGVTVTAVLRTDSFPFPDRRRMASHCADGTCVYYHFWCGSQEDRHHCALHYNEAGDAYNRIVEFSGPSAQAVDRTAGGIRLVTHDGSSLLPLAMLDRRSQSSIPPYCRPESDQGCRAGVPTAASTPYFGSSADTGARCRATTVDELWRDPRQFAGQRICLSGFLGRMVPYGEDNPELYATREEAETRHSERYVTIGVPMTTASQEALSRHSVQPLRVQGVFEFDPRCWPAPGQSSAEYTCFPSQPMRIANAELTFCDAGLCGHARRSDSACNVTSLDNVFREPRRYFGERFCGEALAVPEGRVLKVFPPSRDVPTERNDTVMFLDGATADALDPPDRRPFRLYIEGVIGGMEECFQPPPSGMQAVCTPFRHPIDIRVSTYRRLGGFAGRDSGTRDSGAPAAATSGPFPLPH